VSLFKGMATEAAPLVTPEPTPTERDLARRVPAS
jgi:hypothetical protein